MYTITCNDGNRVIDVYNPVIPRDTHKVINPTLQMGDNVAGHLTMTVPPINVSYNFITRMKSIITVYEDGVELWSGRVIEEKEDFWKNRILTCEGELAYLNDTVQIQNEYKNYSVREFLNALITKHNELVDETKQFQVGNVTVSDATDQYRYTDYESTIECIQNQLIDVYGGHLKIRKENGIRYLDYLQDYENTNTNNIEFGKNLLDYTVNYDLSDLATVIIPKGAKLIFSGEIAFEDLPDPSDNVGKVYTVTNAFTTDSRFDKSGVKCSANTKVLNNSSGLWSVMNFTERTVTGLDTYISVSSVNGGSVYVESSDAVTTYGKHMKVVDFGDITEPSTLLTKAREYLTNIQFDNMELELTVLDLHMLSPYEYKPLRLLEKVRCISEPHGLDREFPITKINIPLDEPESASYTLNSSQKLSMSSKTVTENAAIMNVINNQTTTSSILQNAQDDATRIIKSFQTGYITIVNNENGSQELLISDELDYTKAKKLWRWNVNGLGYSSNGGKTYGTAITMDGSIVADYITTGVLNALTLKGCKILSTKRSTLNDEIPGIYIGDDGLDFCWKIMDDHGITEEIAHLRMDSNGFRVIVGKDSVMTIHSNTRVSGGNIGRNVRVPTLIADQWILYNLGVEPIDN